ncbi:MAG: hypothetical protein ABW022_18875 [Actinoplanes sp.]
MGVINLKLRTDAEVPVPDSGRTNVYADSTTGRPKAKNSSGTIYDFVGNTGPRGSSWTSGTALPTASGLTGDMYLKTDTGGVYQNTGGTSWTLIGNITGPVGPAASLSSSAPPDVAASGAAGSSGTAARADHQHAHGNQGGGSLHAAATGSTAGFMGAADKSKLDGFGTLAVSSTDITASSTTQGASTNLARQDHTHAHGNLPGGTLHAIATAETSGFLGSADKSKLDNIGAGANVTSVAGKTGIVSLTRADVAGLENVTNPVTPKVQTVANYVMTTTATTVATMTVPANTIQPGMVFEVQAAFGTMINTATSTGPIFNLRVNGISAASVTLALTAAQASPGRGGLATFRLIFRTIGASGTYIGNGSVMAGGNVPAFSQVTATSAVNTTAAVTIDLQASVSAATVTTATITSVSIEQEL